MTHRTALELHFQQFRMRAMARQRLSSSTLATNRYSDIPSITLSSSTRSAEARLQKSRSVLVEGEKYDGARTARAWPPRCTYVVRELVQTECDYVKDIGDIIQGYIKPLLSHLFLMAERPNFIRTVFSNIIKIYQLHVCFLEDLVAANENPQDLGRLFLNMDFSLYTEYCTNYGSANEYLVKALLEDVELREFFEECKREVGHVLSIHSFLIKPVQRIVKYPLLLESLVKSMREENHTDYELIEESNKKMCAVAMEINTSFKKMKRQSGPLAIIRRRSKEVKVLQRRRSTSQTDLHRSSSLADLREMLGCSESLTSSNSMDHLDLVVDATTAAPVHKLKDFFESLSVLASSQEGSDVGRSRGLAKHSSRGYRAGWVSPASQCDAPPSLTFHRPHSPLRRAATPTSSHSPIPLPNTQRAVSPTTSHSPSPTPNTRRAVSPTPSLTSSSLSPSLTSSLSPSLTSSLTTSHSPSPTPSHTRRAASPTPSPTASLTPTTRRALTPTPSPTASLTPTTRRALTPTPSPTPKRRVLRTSSSDHQRPLSLQTSLPLSATPNYSPPNSGSSDSSTPRFFLGKSLPPTPRPPSPSPLQAKESTPSPGDLTTLEVEYVKFPKRPVTPDDRTIHSPALTPPKGKLNKYVIFPKSHPTTRDSQAGASWGLASFDVSHASIHNDLRGQLHNADTVLVHMPRPLLPPGAKH